ncbi:MAG TPA: hypothetical protein DCM40_06700, partial [Maribacter sp.]|nr:hypothetical protein [Maribacter sp.]
LQIRSGSNDYFHIDPAGNKAEIAGWTFNETKFYSNPSNEVRGINMNKNKGIRGRDATQAFSISGSNVGNFSFSPPADALVAEESSDNFVVGTAKYTCFLWNTNILLSNGTWKPIQEIEIGELVKTDNGTDVPVLDSFVWSVNTNMKMYTKDKLTTTDSHPILINNEWKTADQLNWDSNTIYVDNLYYLETENNYIAEGFTVSGMLASNHPGTSIKQIKEK